MRYFAGRGWGGGFCHTIKSSTREVYRREAVAGRRICQSVEVEAGEGNLGVLRRGGGGRSENGGATSRGARVNGSNLANSVRSELCGAGIGLASTARRAPFRRRDSQSSADQCYLPRWH